MKRNFKKWMLVGLCAMMSMQTSVAVLAEEDVLIGSTV